MAIPLLGRVWRLKLPSLQTPEVCSLCISVQLVYTPVAQREQLVPGPRILWVLPPACLSLNLSALAVVLFFSYCYIMILVIASPPVSFLYIFQLLNSGWSLTSFVPTCTDEGGRNRCKTRCWLSLVGWLCGVLALLAPLPS